MIKIIVSGTYDGFSPRYSSDGILDDQISTHLLDRRRFLSRDADRLYKEGYSFQPLAGGILFHKIILLYDGFGRDGFVMASLFLPEGEMLGGAVIKETLDAIIRDYKVRIQNGIANVELDWSFVKIRADELNSKVQSMTWKKRPSNNGSNKTALIKGADSRVADYFQYPNPLNSGCTGYGQVFLTESLLDPAMASDDSEQGYKVLTTDDVDIDNPEYAIVYENKQQGARLSSERKTITKKELDSHPGNISLGTLSKPGYRSAEVMIKEADKISKDGFSVAVTLPTLVQKKASVKIDIFDNDNAEVPIPGYRCTFKWSQSSFGQSKLLQPLDGVFSFYGEDCDTRWNFTIECESYETYSGEVNVLDGKTETKKVILKPKPLWNIYIQLPNGESKLNKSAIPEDDLNYYTQKAELYLKNNGLDIDKSTRDDVAHKITIVGKKKVVLEYDGNKGLGRNEEEIKDDNLPQTSETYVLRLDKKSQKYSLFKNYRKKACIEKEVDSAIKILEKYSTSQRNGKKNPNADKINKIIGYLRDGKLEFAKDEINNLTDNYVSTPQGKKFVDNAKNAINLTKKWKQIPDVVIKPTDVEYKSDNNSHWLECSRTKAPGESEEIVFGKDKYRYSVPYHSWTKGLWGNQHCIVQRNLLPKYKLLNWVLGVVLVGVLAFAAYFIFFNKGDKQVAELKDTMKNSIALMNTYPNGYCGDSIYNSAKEVKTNYKTLADKNTDLLNDSVYKEFDGILSKQSEYKIIDSVIFNQAVALFDSPIDVFDLQKWDELMKDWQVLTNAHKDSLDYMWQERQERIEKLKKQAADEAAQAEEAAFKKCTTFDACVSFLTNYPNSIHVTEVRAKREEFREKEMYQKCRSANATVKDCDDYLKRFPQNPHAVEVGRIKNRLAINESAQSSNVKNAENNEKKQINNAGSLFIALEPNNIESFDSKYDVSQRLKRRKEKIIDDAKKMGQVKYKEAYDAAKNEPVDKSYMKLDKLEEQMKKKWNGK